jgi:hypothetical protein
VADGQPQLPDVISDVVSTALGKEHRADPATGRTGGPAGNARLTAWLGLLLLVAFVVECVTLLRLDQLIDVHIIVGVVLVALVLAKTATTGWRIARYYLGDAGYREAGPPPLLLRLLGPAVVLGGLAVLGTGLALIALGRSARHGLFTVGGFGLDAVTLHQAAFVFWLAVTVPHTLGRIVPAWQLTVGRRRRALAGGWQRAIAVSAVVTIGAIVAAPVLGEAGEWLHHGHDHDDGLSRKSVIVEPAPAADRRR